MSIAPIEIAASTSDGLGRGHRKACGAGKCFGKRYGHQRLSPNIQRRINEFIEKNISERFMLSDLAEVACMSRFHFARTFRRTFGTTPMEYVLRARVERAKTMLLGRQPSIADVAAVFGFCDQSHFTRSFRRITGCTPRQFIAGCTRVARTT